MCIINVINGALDPTEKNKIENMFAGDSKRDASSKIRGFLFQDLVAVDKLLAAQTVSVYLECLEDVDVLCDNNELEIIQVKYLPGSGPQMKEIMTDLYYQFLRTEVLGLSLNPKPQLLVHTNEKVTIPDLNKMKAYINCTRENRPQQIENAEEWLLREVYKFETKEEQKKIFFDQMASEASISCFLNNFTVVSEGNISSYQKKVADRLSRKFSDINFMDNEETQEKILMSLATEYIRERYILEHPQMEDTRFDCSKFSDYIQDNTVKVTERHIAVYLISIIDELYATIIDNNMGMADGDIGLLWRIVNNTRTWISELAATEEGQYKLFNTISYRNKADVDKYPDLNLSRRMIKIAESSENFKMFLKVLWKLMLDICKDKDNFNVVGDANMLNPQTYIDASVKSYICIKFAGDFVDTSVILPPIREMNKKEDKNNILFRMYSEKPQKWYMSGEERGKKEYTYRVSDIPDGNIGNENEDIFYIECLKCIGMDKGQWCTFEKCRDNIFQLNCIGE